MSNFNELKQQLLSRIGNANSLSDLREITKDTSAELQSISQRQPNREREKHNQEIKAAHEKVWAERRKLKP